MSSNHKTFFGGLESLRGIAAMMVVLYHIDLIGWVNPLTNHLIFKNGYLMVDLFFVLSGFVICHNYGGKIKSAQDTAQFIFLRFGRLYPLHFSLLLVFLGVEIAKYACQIKIGFVPHQSSAFTENNTTAFMANLLLIHPFFSFSNATFNSVSWSIGVEFYTYLFFAAAVLVAPDKKKISMVACLLASLAALLLVVLRSPGLNATAGFSFLRCLMGFFAGVIAYQIYDGYQLRISRWSEIVGPFVVVILVVFLSLKSNPGWDFATVPLFAILIVSVASDRASWGIAKVLNLGPMRWLGAVSYSIYMSQLLVIIFMRRVLFFVQRETTQNSGWWATVFVILTVAAILGISQLTYRWIEITGRQCFRHWAKKLFKPDVDVDSIPTGRQSQTSAWPEAIRRYKE